MSEMDSDSLIHKYTLGTALSIRNVEEDSSVRGDFF